MSSIKLVLTKEPGIYRRDGVRETTFVAVIPNGVSVDGKQRQIRRSFPSFAEAKDFKIRTLHEQREGTYVSPSRELTGDYLKRWVDTQRDRVKPATIYAYVQCVERLSALWPTRLGELTPARVYALTKAMLAAGLSSSTVELTFRILRAALDDAVRHRLIRENPCRSLDVPRGKPKRALRLTSAEVLKFRAAMMDDPYRALFETALETGMRFGELTALRWQDVDLDRRTITVLSTVTNAEDGKRMVGDPKSAKGRRVIAISTELVTILRAHRAAVAEQRLLDAGWNRIGLVFPGDCGGYCSPGAARKALVAVCDRAGVQRITFHSLRHTSGTEQIEAGIPIKTVSERLGHASVATTLDLYVHPDRESHQRAADAIAARFRGGDDNDVVTTAS